MIPVPSGVVRITTLLAAVATFHVVVQGAAFAQLHADHLALGLLGGFANGLGDLFRLAFAEADAAFLIANNNQSGEAKALTTLDGFADAVDRDQTVCEFRCFFPFAARAAAVFTFCHENILFIGGLRRMGQSWWDKAR